MGYLYAGSRNGLLIKVSTKLLNLDALAKSPILEVKASEQQERKLTPEILKIGDFKLLTNEEWCVNLMYIVYRRAIYIVTAETMKEKNKVFL